MESAPLPDPLRDLVDRIASHPHGLGFLHSAPLESVAVTLGVSPRVADEARLLLETPSGRARIIAEVRRARRQRARIPKPAAAEGAPDGGGAVVVKESGFEAPARSAEELIERARRHPLGLHFLLRAPLESVAVTLGVHPFLVVHARRRLHRRGRDHPAPPDGAAPGG